MSTRASWYGVCDGCYSIRPNSPGHISHLSSYKNTKRSFPLSRTYYDGHENSILQSGLRSIQDVILYTVFGDLKSGRRPLVVLKWRTGHLALVHAPARRRTVPEARTTRRALRPARQWATRRVCATSPLTPFFTPGLFVSELDNLLRHLGITHDFDLLGQSWGVMFAVEYIAAHHPTGLKHLVLASGSASYPLWREALAGLRSQWPRDFQDMLGRHEMNGTTDTPEYQEGLMQFYRDHILNLEVWPPEALKSMTQMGEDPAVYRAM
jgi:pimeloyl-ACP methyl ester carboxylesterase